MLNTLGTTEPGEVARDSVLAPQTWSLGQAVGAAGYFWLILCAVGESLLSFAFQAEPPNPPCAGSEIQGQQISQAKGVCRLRDFVGWGDKGSKGGPGEGGAGVLRLPRTEQRAFFLHPFRRSAISCVVPAVSMLHLLLLNHFLFTASKNFLVKSLICHKISLYSPFWAGFTNFFSLSSVYGPFRLRSCVLCVHAVSYVRKVCARSVVLSVSICPFFSSPSAFCFLQTWAKKQAVALKAGYPFCITEGSRYLEERLFPLLSIVWELSHKRGICSLDGLPKLQIIF